MPIKGFNSIQEQTREKIISIFGQKPTRNNKRFSLIIPSSKRIPYICDKSREEFSLVWRKLQYNLTVPHYKENIRTNKPLTEEDKIFIKNNYPNKGINFCGSSLNIHVGRIAQYIKSEKLKRYTDPTGLKTCRKCKQILPIDNFWLTQNKKVISKCKNCSSKDCKSYSNRIKSTKDGQKLWTAKSLLGQAKRRSNKYNIPFELDLNWVILNMAEKCPVLNIPYIFCAGKSFASSPSIDRIIPKLGYTKENCRIISLRANKNLMRLKKK